MRYFVTLPLALLLLPLAQADELAYAIFDAGVDHYEIIGDADVFPLNSVGLSDSPNHVYAGFDFDASAQTIWAIHDFSAAVGIYNREVHWFQSQGPSNLPAGQVRGLTAHPDGLTWYAIAFAGSQSDLYVGDVTTGVFALVGTIAIGQHMVGVTCDDQGRLFSLSESDDQLYSIDPLTGAGTPIAPIGFDMQGKQGFDAHWPSQTLRAWLVGPFGQGRYVHIDPANGNWLASYSTSSGAGVRLTIQSGLQPSTGYGVPYCRTLANSSGQRAVLSGSHIAGGSGLHLEVQGGPVGKAGFFLFSGQPSPLNPSHLGSGFLCLGGFGGVLIARYSIAGGPLNSVGQFDSAGVFQNLVGTSVSGSGFDVPLGSPAPTVYAPLQSGETYYFQLWYRDTLGGAPTSNLSNGLAVHFP